MSDFNIVVNIIENKLKNYDKEYSDRAHFEIKEIYKQGLEQYWIDLIKSQRKFDSNKNGLVIPFLLKMTNIDPIKDKIPHDIKRDSDWPDIDLDFISEAREKIKEYASNTYGFDKVCGVGTWQTYKPKLALQDVARALGHRDKLNEIISMTTELPDDFDVVESFDDSIGQDNNGNYNFEQYAIWVNEDEVNRDIAQTAFKLVGKIKTQGKHAGGLIISKIPLNEFVPMCKSKNDNLWTSEWTEGGNVQLSKFGFVKYDVLGLKTLEYIWRACKLIERNHGIKINWEEIGYANKKALEVANKLNTDSIFQFDTDIAKGILSKGGVKSFMDLLVYTSLGRPGPMPMIDEYIARRDDPSESWKENEHPKVIELLHDTYGIVVFQEQLTAFWTTFCGFSIPEADKARKVIAKKWEDQLKPIEEKAIKGSSKILGEEQAKEWADKLRTFGRYAFNKCLSNDTILIDPITRNEIAIEELYKKYKNGSYTFYLESIDGPDLVDDVHFNGEQEVYEIEFDNEIIEKVTIGHKYLCKHDNDYHTVKEIIDNNFEVLCNDMTTKIKSIKSSGIHKTYSPQMHSNNHCYAQTPDKRSPIQANSHAVSYTIQAYRCLYLKSHYPTEWWCSVLNACKDDRIPQYVAIARKESLEFNSLDINNLSKIFDTVDGKIVPGLLGVKGIGDKLVDKINTNIKYKDIDEFIECNGKSKQLLERLIKLGAFDKIHKNKKALWYWYQYQYNKDKNIRNEIDKHFAWSDEDIEKEIDRQSKEYFKLYPKRKKLPSKITNWKPKINLSRDEVIGLIKNDYTYEEQLEFQAIYLGYHWDSPMDIYIHNNITIPKAKMNGYLECVIVKNELRKTKNGNKFMSLYVTDGSDNAKIQLWKNDFENYSDNMFDPNVGLALNVIWNEQYRSFTLERGTEIKRLKKKSESEE